jgi:molybdopterin-guanine dinucleotide biosynthesis protein A
MYNATGIVLAGGKGSRINKNKALITLPDGKTLLQKCLDSLRKVLTEVLIVTNQRELYQDYDARLVEDMVKAKGPLGGIYTGLSYSTTHCNFVIGCDMPFPQPRLIEMLLQGCDDYDVVIPKTKGEVEPLFAVYSKSCLPVISDHLQKNDLKIRKIFEKLKVQIIREEQIDDVDPQHLSFFNINTEEDLRKAQTLMLRIPNSS